MKIGVPAEIKEHEYRVGLTPSSVRELVHHGHNVLVESKAGTGIGASDNTYCDAGAEIAATAHQVFEQADLVVKVKEPQLAECALLNSDQTLFTYLHLAADKPQAEALMKSGVTAISYETVTDSHGGLPLLIPMSEVAGRMSIQAGAHFLEKEPGGAGILLGGVPGVAAGKVVIIGGGTAGTHAAQMAVGLGAQVVIIEKSTERLRELDCEFQGRLLTLFSTRDAIAKAVKNADLVVGSVLIPGAAAPKLVTRDMIAQMAPGSVVVDIAIDQGGCFETSRPTSHSHPTFIEQGVIHYCVTNMPGAVARTSAQALNNATLPFVLALANNGVQTALEQDPHLARGLNVSGGQITHRAVADALGLTFSPLKAA